LRWLTTPEDGEGGARARIRNRTAWTDGQSREGRLFRVIGALEDNTRMARVLISVPDPHAYRAERADQPRLMIGSYVEARMRGKALPNVVRLDRDYVRDGETVWVMEDNKLSIRDVEIVVQDARYAYVDEGLNDGDQVVTTNLATVTDGAPLRLEGSEEQPVPDPAQE